MGIAQDIQSASRINNTFAFRYVKRLMDDFGLSRVNADWIISVWCSCYGEKVLGKPCEITVQKQGSGPAIKAEQSTSGGQYGDLFTYRRSGQGAGLAVTGFRGDNKRTIIFQKMLFYSIMPEFRRKKSSLPIWFHIGRCQDFLEI